MSDDPVENPAPRPPRWPGAIAAALMVAAVLFTFRSPELAEGEWRLFGLDYMMLHQRRIDFALESLRQHGTIPAWYPRELIGTPFWSNIQSFPLLPTRLVLLPAGRENLFTIAVYLSAVAAAGMTYLFARRLGAGVAGSAAAGWTYVCGGYFASRTAAGQLGMLETYWALPLMLYLVDRVATARTGRPLAAWTLAIAAATGSLAVSAHPQHPIYAVAVGAAYALVRCRPAKRIAVVAAAMVLGIACYGVQLVPMGQLIARSSRTLPLDPPGNDIVMPWSRLRAMVWPWIDGAPGDTVVRPPGVGDVTYDNVAYFWDTVNFLGWVPLAAVVVVAIAAAAATTRGRRPGRTVVFVVAASVVALLLALPVAKALPAPPFIILRSPARWMYVVNFGLCLALAGATTLLLRRATRGAAGVAIAIAAAAALSFHAWQVHRHARAFVVAWDGFLDKDPRLEDAVRRTAGDGRVGIDKAYDFSFTRRYDDVGFFDSIMLADVYRGLLDLNTFKSERLNVQEMDGGEMSGRSLRALGVRLVLTFFDRPDLPKAATMGTLNVYELGDTAAARTAFFPATAARYLSYDDARLVLRTRTFDVRDALLLPIEAAPPGAAAGVSTPAAAQRLPYRRPNPDRIESTVDAPANGYVRVLESFDRGWRATVDGRPAPVFQANNMVMAIAVPPGRHEVALEYFTPGLRAGMAVSLAGVLGLGGLAWGLSRRGRAG